MKKSFYMEVFACDMSKVLVTKTVDANSMKQAVEVLGIKTAKPYNATTIEVTEDRQIMAITDVNGFKFIISVTLVETGDGT